MKRYIALLSILCTFPGIAFAQKDTKNIMQCPWSDGIDCVISHFKEKKNVSGSIGDGNKAELIFDKSQIIFTIENTNKKQLKECKAASSAFFKIQATLDEIKNKKSPNFSYMKCSDKVLQIDPPKPEKIKTPLKVQDFKVIDASTLALAFNQNIQHSTVWVRVVDRKDYTMVPIKKYEADGPKAVKIHLEKPLLAANDYNMTINTVLSENQSTIERGIDSIQTFTTADTLKWAPNLKKEEAPTPPATELPEQPQESQETQPKEEVWVEANSVEATDTWTLQTDENEEEQETEEPKTRVETWMDITILFFVVILCVAGIFVFRRKQS